MPSSAARAASRSGVPGGSRPDRMACRMASVACSVVLWRWMLAPRPVIGFGTVTSLPDCWTIWQAVASPRTGSVVGPLVRHQGRGDEGDRPVLVVGQLPQDVVGEGSR